MKKRLLILAAALYLSPYAYAGDLSSVVIAVDYTPQAPAARMEVIADYVAVPIAIENDSDDLVKRTDEIEKVYQAVTQKLAAYPDLAIRPGVISLSPWSDASESSFSVSSSEHGSARLYVVGRLRQDTNIFAVTKRIYQAVSEIPRSRGTKISLDDTVLGVDDPEKYRSQVTALIAKSVADARKTLGSAGFVQVEGLESPVTVMQLNDRQVALFINYRVRIQIN